MNTPVIVPIYAGVLGLGLIVLSLRVVQLRRSAKVGLGTGGDRRIERAIRCQANFAEYVPMTLILLAFAEIAGTSPLVLHVLCAALVAGRIAHALGLGREPEPPGWREVGIGTTLTVLSLAAPLAAAGAAGFVI